jgi:seryl-tRNA synthetase
MIDIKILREHPEEIANAMSAKNAEVDIPGFLELDQNRRKMIKEIEDLRAQQKRSNESIASASGEEREEKISKMRLIAQDVRRLEKELAVVDDQWTKGLLLFPNPALPDVKVGRDETENEVIKTVGAPRPWETDMKDYLSLGALHDWIDIQRAGKVSGTRFGYLKRDLARLEFAIVSFAMDRLLVKGFIPIVPPTLVKEPSMRAMGYLERGSDEVYQTTQDGFYLIGTSEQSVGPMHQDEIFSRSELPRRYIAFSTCYRREAGSYGKDTRGILRVHQFDKLEMFSFTLPEQSDAEHELLLRIEEELVQALELPYRVIKMCTGDLGDPAARKYDIECWIPSQQTYRETHSTSTCTDFQARRLNIRYRKDHGGQGIVHTLNGTAFAIGRILIALLENHQQHDGTVRLPTSLQPYLGGKMIIP